MNTPIGRCSNCGGTVILFIGPYLSTVPPVPTCSVCGATPQLPVIQMGPARKTSTTPFVSISQDTKEEQAVKALLRYADLFHRSKPSG